MPSRTNRGYSLGMALVVGAAWLGGGITWFASPAACAAEAGAKAAAPARPNILFCLADDWSYPHASAYGCPWIKTPTFDRVAREGLLFTHCYTPNAKCAPSRSCILTGRNSWQLKAAANHVPFFPVEFKTYAEALAEHGYFVGQTGKGWAPGMALDAKGMLRPMAGQPFMNRKAPPPTKGISPCDYAANFADFLAAAPVGEPWCFWYGGNEPHRAYEYGTGVSKGGKDPASVDRIPGFWPDNDTVRNDVLDYAFEVEHFDRHLGRMLDLLEQRGQLQNTIVVISGDNGMPFPRAKGNQFELSSHMPLAIMWPAGIRAPGRTIDDYVSFIDFAPTFVELAGLDWSETGMAPAAGRPLQPIFAAEQGGRVDPARDHVLIGQERHDVGRPHDWGYPIRGIVKDDMLYLINYEPTRWPACNPETGYLNTDGSPTKTEVLRTRTDPAVAFWQMCFGKRPSEELYVLQNDPDCIHNLALSPDSKYTAVRTKLHAQLEAELKAQGDPRMFGQGHVFDEYPYAQKERDFYERYMGGEKIDADWVNPSDFEKEPLEP